MCVKKMLGTKRLRVKGDPEVPTRQIIYPKISLDRDDYDSGRNRAHTDAEKKPRTTVVNNPCTQCPEPSSSPGA